MDINEVKKQEEERLKKVNTLHEANKRNNKNQQRIVKVLCIALTVFFLSCLLVLCESLFIQSQLKAKGNKSLSKLEFLSKLPSGSILVNQNIKYYLNTSIADFNKESIDSEEVESRFQCLEEQNISKEQSDLITHFRSVYESYATSKNGYLLGKQYEEDDDYIAAMDEYQKVISEDKNYSTVIAKISDIKENYINSVIQMSYNILVTSDDLKEVNNLFKMAVGYFPEDSELLAYQSMGESTGNPLYYRIAKTFCDQLKLIEKDVNHTEAECKEITLYKLSSTSIIFSVAFHTNYPPACYFYYEVNANGELEELEAEDFMEYLNENDKVMQTSFSWDESLEKTEKLNLVLENMVNLTNSASEKIASDSVEQIEANNDAMKERIENNTNSGGINMLLVVLMEMGALAVIIWIVTSVFKNIFS